MFGLFKSNTYKPDLNKKEKLWVEENIKWFIEAFGLDKLKQHPFILPTIENFPYNNLNDTDQFQKLFEQLCFSWELNPDEIETKFFDDIKSKQWSSWIPQGEFIEPAGLFYQSYTTEEKKYNIQLAKSNLVNPQLLVSVIVHELAHIKLISGKYLNTKRPDIDEFTDLTSIFFGFGIFVANSCQTKDLNWISRTAYLPIRIISYANALICYITDNNAKDYTSFLNTNTREVMIKDYTFLSNTNDTILFKDKIQESEYKNKLIKQISNGYKEKTFSVVIEAEKKMLEFNPKDKVVFNNIGYALIQQKQYLAAIEEFNKAIDIDPYFDYPFNNRGYCKLQLRDLENAFDDIKISNEMNPNNSFSWRNLGVYYFMKNDFEKALEHFEIAKNMDEKTEMINFYLGKCYFKLGKTEESEKYLEISKSLEEHNDSIID